MKLVTIKFKVQSSDEHLQGLKDTVSLATADMQDELSDEGIIVTEGEWHVDDVPSVQDAAVGKMTDIRDPQFVEVEVSPDKTLWVNINGECRLRVQGTYKLVVKDNRPNEWGKQ